MHINIPPFKYIPYLKEDTLEVAVLYKLNLVFYESDRTAYILIKQSSTTTNFRFLDEPFTIFDYTKSYAKPTLAIHRKA